jgi:glycosyltransferase involved in cell wall biosynthesis
MIFAHGPKFGNEKIAFLKKADIFVFPSYFHNETFGLVNLEAMQYSLPIVSTFEGGIPDVVEDGITGYLVPQLDSVMLADKLECLIKKPELRTKMGIAGKERFKSLFTYEHFQENIKNILGSAALNN